jgi:hypothetical protein
MKLRMLKFASVLLVLVAAFYLGEERAKAQTTSPIILESIFQPWGRCVGPVTINGKQALIFQADDGGITIVGLTVKGLTKIPAAAH